jgi:hypothetical protein
MAYSRDLDLNFARLVTATEVQDVESIDVMGDEITFANRAQQVAIKRENRLSSASYDYARDLLE